MAGAKKGGKWIENAGLNIRNQLVEESKRWSVGRCSLWHSHQVRHLDHFLHFFCFLSEHRPQHVGPRVPLESNPMMMLFCSTSPPFVESVWASPPPSLSAYPASTASSAHPAFSAFSAFSASLSLLSSRPNSMMLVTHTHSTNQMEILTGFN